MRFFHYALFDGELLSPYYYLVTYVILAACHRLLGFRAMRTTQMVTQYRWLYERTGPSWRDRAPEHCRRLSWRDRRA